MLTFNLKKEWFDKIKSGKKTHEYREVKDYWTDKFVKEFYSLEKRKYPVWFKNVKTKMLSNFRTAPMLYSAKLCFTNGMVSEEKKPRLYAKLKSIRIVNGLKTDLKIDIDVYDIKFELIKE